METDKFGIKETGMLVLAVHATCMIMSVFTSHRQLFKTPQKSAVIPQYIVCSWANKIAHHLRDSDQTMV